MSRSFRLISILFFVSFWGFAQPSTSKNERLVSIPIVDSLYREDQFYARVTYNTLVNTPADFSQNKFSTGLAFGFLRDFPLNKNRNIAVAAGVGYSYSIYHHNIMASEADGEVHYAIISDFTDYSTNRTSLHDLEIPLELRWRSSTFQSHKFWRVYTGVKVSYNLRNRMFFNSDEAELEVINNDDIRQWRTGVYISAGYNTWNLYAYYGLTSLFDGAKLNGKDIKVNAIHLGLQFYIL